MCRKAFFITVWALLLSGGVQAQTTEWWTANYPNMASKDQLNTWVAQSGDTLWIIVRKIYGIPNSDPDTINRVMNALIRFNNAMRDSGSYNAAEITPITDRDQIFEGKRYLLPDPTSINRILTGASSPSQAVADAIKSGSNQEIAQGNSTGASAQTTGVPAAPTTTQSGSPAGQTDDSVVILTQKMELANPEDTTVPGSLEASYAGLRLTAAGMYEFNKSYLNLPPGSAAGALVGSEAGATLGGN